VKFQLTSTDIVGDLRYAAAIRKRALDQASKIQREANERHAIARAEAKRLRITSSRNLLEWVDRAQEIGLSMRRIASIIGVTPATIYKLRKSLESEGTDAKV
jgi:hypothetical protein